MNPNNLKQSTNTNPPKRGRPFGSKNVKSVQTNIIEPKKVRTRTKRQNIYLVAVKTDGGTQVFEFSNISKRNEFTTLLSKLNHAQWTVSRMAI